MKILQLINFQKRINKYKGKKIVAYGAGINAKDILEKFDFSALNILAFADTKFHSSNGIFHEYKTIPPDKIKNMDPDIILIFVYNDFAVKEYLKKNFPELDNTKKVSIRDKNILDKLKLYFCGYL